MAELKSIAAEKGLTDAEHVEYTTRTHAQEQEALDHTAGIWATLRGNPKIVLFLLFANIGSFMYGFDNLSLSLCLSMPAFQQTFGDTIMTKTGVSFLIPAKWQSAWNACGQVATMIGSLLAGPIADRFGRRVVFVIGGIVSMAGVAVVYISSTPGVFLAGKMINGVALGLCLTAGQVYVSEITPLRIRGIALAFYTFCQNLGYLVAASIAFKRIAIFNTSAYKVLFASEWTWPALILVCVFLVPESPYYLVQHDKSEKAEKAIKRLNSSSTDSKLILDQIILTNEEERQIRASSADASFLDLFRGTNWRRTRIILYCNGMPQMIGATFNANGPYFLVSAGMSTSHIAMMIELGIAFGIAAAIITFFVMSRFGRRPIILFGLSLAALFYLLMGIAGSVKQNSATLWTIGITLQLTWWCFGPAIGPSFAIAGEISQTRLRAKSLAVGFMFNYFFSTVWNVVVPYMFNADEGNLGGKMGWIFFATAVIAIIVVWLEFPETKDRSYAELDEMFEQKVKTREFKTFQTGNAFNTGTDVPNKASSRFGDV